MSRMWPSYVRHELKSPSGLGSKYSLYLYRERVPGEPQRKATGRPALFLPGNAGSYGQVRSVASWAHEAFRSGEEWDYEVDWWAADFNEDLSAFHGSTLREQATYVNEVLAYLHSISPTPQLPIPVLAHSMGGVVARLALLEPNHPPGSVDTIITLSSPHAYPPAPLDDTIEAIYSRLSAAARQPQNTTLLISLSGGLLDTQLPAEPSSLSLARLWPKEALLDGFTSALPSLWSSVDHLAMMWCDQVRAPIARAVLRDSAFDRSGNLGLRKRREVWRRALGFAVPEQEDIMQLRESTFGAAPEQALALQDVTAPNSDNVSTWQVNSGQQLDFELITSFPVGADPSSGPPLRQPDVFSVLMCRPGQEQASSVSCKSVMPWTWELLPASPVLAGRPSMPRFPMAHIRYEAPGEGIRRLKLSAAYLESKRIRWIRVEKNKVPWRGPWGAGWYTAGWTRLPSVVDGSILRGLRLPVEATAPLARIIVPRLDNSLLAYRVRVHVDPQCQIGDVEFAPMLRLTHRTTHDSMTYPSLSPLASETFITSKLSLIGASPYMPPPERGAEGTLLELWWKPRENCARAMEAITVRVDWLTSLGLVLMRYRIALAAFPLAFVLFASAIAWSRWDSGAPFPSLLTHLFALRPLAHLTAVFTLVSSIQAYFSDVRPSSGWIQDAAVGLSSLPLGYSLVIGTLLLLIAHTLALAGAITLQALVAGLSSALRYSRLSSFVVWGPPQPSRIQVKSASGIGTGAVLILVIFFVPYQFVFLVAFVVQLVTAVRSQHSWHCQSIATRRNSTEQLPGQAEEEDETSRFTLKTTTSNAASVGESRAAQHLLLLNISFWLLPLKAPVLIVWARNLLMGWRNALDGEDHNPLRVVTVLLIAQVVSSGRVIERARTKLQSRVTRGLFFAVATYTVAYGPRHAYSLFTLVSLLFTWLLALHFLARRAGHSFGSASTDTPLRMTR